MSFSGMVEVFVDVVLDILFDGVLLELLHEEGVDLRDVGREVFADEETKCL